MDLESVALEARQDPTSPNNEETKIDTLLYKMDKAADQAKRTLNPQPKSLKAALEAFGKYFYPKKIVIFTSTMFANRNQGEHESAESFMRSVYELAEECNYGKMKDELILDRLNAGMQDQQISIEHQLAAKCPIPTTRTWPDVLPQAARFLVYALRPNSESPSPSVPARNDRCTICNKIGHFTRLYLHAETNDLMEVHHNDNDSTPLQCQDFILVIKEEVPSQAWIATLNVGAEFNKLIFKMDTGAD
ncbi:hypothetical protein B566_EDAN013763 [Ephemera danica]|nr:hypothetical protein B566_EDAN013763 [Ephemera danica]